MKRLAGPAATTLVVAVLALALRAAAEPAGLWWLLVPTLALAIAIGCGTPRRRDGRKRASVAFRRGWLFGTLFVLVDLAWVIGPATTRIALWIAPVAVVLTALEALPVGLAAWLFARTKDRSALAFCLGVPALYALLETARASGPLGLPLATLGATQTAGPLAVTFAFGSVPLATFAALVVAASVVWLARAARDGALTRRAGRGFAFGAACGAVALAGATFWWHGALAGREPGRIARIGVVQAGPIDVGRSFASSAADYAAATQRLPHDVDFVLWPEGVLFFTKPDAAEQRASAVGAARAFGKTIFAGTTWHVRGALHNDLIAIGPAGGFATVYTKRRLVPFGEYQPFAFGSAARASYAAGAATSEAPVRLGDGAPFGVLICYEVAFSELTRASALAGASYLVAVLNDSMFDGTDGPDQLSQLLKARAIESGIAIVRADAVSPSGLVDADGAWVGRPSRADGVLVANVPVGLATPFRRFGPLPTLVALGAVALATLLPLVRRRRPAAPAVTSVTEDTVP